MARTRRRGWKVRTIGPTLAAVLALALPGAVAATAAPGDATHVYIDAGRSSSQPVGGPAGSLHQAWAFTADGEVSGALIVGGRVFADDGESVFALDAATGRRLWQRRLGRTGTIVYAGGHVLAVSGFADAVVALDPATGATAWLSSVPRENENIADADEGHVVLRSSDASRGGIDVLDTATGARVWSTDTKLTSDPVIAGDELLAGPQGISRSASTGYDEEIDAYNLDTGARRVVTRGTTGGAGTLSIHAGLLYANSQLERSTWPYVRGAALDPVTGAQAGSDYDASDYPASDAHGIYLRNDLRDPGTWDVTTTLSGFDGPGTAARWTYTPPNGNGLTQAPLAAGGRVWAAGQDAGYHSTVVGLDPISGAITQTLDLGAYDDPDGNDPSAHGPLSAGGGLLLVPSGDRLVAFSGDAPVAGSPTGPVPALAAPDAGTDAGVAGDRQDAGRTGLAPGAPAPPLAVRWQVAAGTLEGPPLIVGDTAIVARRAQDADGVRAGQVMLTAYALSDGAMRWDVPLVDDDGQYGGWSLVAEGGRVYAADRGTALAAFDASDGRRLWSHAWESSLTQWPPPVARGGFVYVVHGITAIAYDGATGDVAWQRSLNLGGNSGWTWPQPAADDDHYYALASSPDRDKPCALTALDRRTGAIDWSVPRRCIMFDGIAAAGGRVAFDGAVFDAVTGRVIDTARGTQAGALAPNGVMLTQDRLDDFGLLTARRPGAADVWSVHDGAAPLLTGPLVWTTVGQRLTALRIGDGSVAWQSAVPAWDVPGLAAAAGVLLMTPRDGGLVAWAHDDAAGPEVAVEQPVSPTRSATSVLRFSVPAGAGAATSCAVDGGAFAACTSPWTTPALAAGEHRLRVRAGSGPVASVVVAVDRTAPVTTVQTVVPAYVSSLILRFTAGEAARFECAWDGDAPRQCFSGGNDLGNEVSGEGRHSVTVHAIDMAGNVESPGTTLRWTSDHTSPVVTASLSFRKTTADTVRPDVTQSEPGRLECALDDGAWATCPDPVAATATIDGFHTLAVREVDRSGITGGPTSVTWERDTKGPEPDIAPLWDQVQRDRLSVYLKAGDLHDLARAECRIDADAWATCGDDLRWDHGGLAQGHHVFQYRAWDDVGNQGPTIVRGFDAYPGPVIAGPPMEVAWRVGWQGSLSKGDSWGGTYPDDCTIDGVTRPCPGGSLVYLGDLAPGWHWAVQTTRDTAGRAVCSRTAWWPIALPDGSVPGPAPRSVVGGGWSTGPGDPGPNDEPGGSSAPPCGSYASAPGADPWPSRAPEDPPADPPSDPGSGGTTDPPSSDPTTSAPGDTDPPPSDAPASDPPATDPPASTPPASDPPASDAPVVALAAPPAPPLALIGASSPAATTPGPTTTTSAPRAFGPATLRRHGATALALAVRAPARGVLTVRVTRDGTTLATARQSVRRAGSVRVTVRPTAAGRLLLRRHHGALRVRLLLRLGTAATNRSVRVG